MAEAVVKFVLNKLADVIVKEAQLLGGVRKEFERVQCELKRIQCCLEDADSKRKNVGVQNWLNELCDVAYNIEDVTDTFFLEVEGYCKKDTSFLQKLKVCNKPLDVYLLHKLGTELDNIQNKLEGIFKSRVNYGIKDLPDKSKGVAVQMTFRRTTYQEVDEKETEVIGLQNDKNNILNLLRSKEIARRAVITIVGPGGLGKTTLAHMVYRSARAEFKYHIMLSISQQFSQTDLLRKMLLSISKQISLTDRLRNKISKLIDSVPEDQVIGEAISMIRSFLSSRRYLIILDDVWRVDLWNQLKDALPDVKNESRVLMTSRFINVAESVDSKMMSYELDFLDDDTSRDLLLKKAFPYQEPGEECPSNLLELADELSKKCNGLPLALIVLGGILSTKGPSYHVWKRVLRTMDWHSNGKECMEILAMSYEDMPYYLKPCFLYLASFPEDYEISAKRLIRMWVAEGFVPCEGKTTMEEMAENYLEQLIERCMVQVSSRSIYGLIKCCKVHDILRDLAMHEAEQQNFVAIYSEARDVNQLKRGIRRASLQDCIPKFVEYVCPNIRSLLLFNMKVTQCSHLRLLKVLELVDAYLDDDACRVFEELIHLKYLVFRNCNVSMSTHSFRRMKTLETLDLRGARFYPQADVLWPIGTLRHLLFDFDVEGPPSTADLRNLQTLRWVRASRTWASKLPLLDNLCKLGVIYSPINLVLVTNLLSTLRSLVSLRISARQGPLPKEIVYPVALPNYQNLQSLYLKGYWSENVTLEASLFPRHLVKLTLQFCLFELNPMPELGKLESLKKICLGIDVMKNWDSTIICAEGFPVLQYLKVIDWRIKILTVAREVMPKLLYLQVSYDLEIHLPPLLQHLTVSRKISGLPGFAHEK